MTDNTHQKVLTVDDAANICMLVSRWLQKEGYDCQTAQSGHDALALMETEKFTLLLSDINMPRMTGMELLRAVREEHPDLAVIMLTAVDDREIALAALECGAYGYVIKPFERMEVVINVANGLRRRQLEILNRDHLQELERLVAERTRDLEQAYGELKNSHEQILQQEKMACIGQLSAGVAHEINNPTGFVASNLGSLARYVDRLAEFIKAQSTALKLLNDERATAELKELRKSLKLDFIIEDARDLINESIEGTDRIKKIVQGLKNFSRKDQEERGPAQINDLLESTLNVVWNEIKYKATVEKEYGELPITRCFGQQLGQVFMNLLVNAAHAIETKGVITIKTWAEDDSLFVRISDNGSGIAKENLEKIFEAFFTTKEVGKGTGLGLSISADIIRKHAGEISVESTVGTGTQFTVKLPVVTE